MGSKGRMPPPHPHPRRSLGGPGMMHPDSYGLPLHPPPGGYPPYDMLPPPEVMEQKLAAQHVDMQKLATENQRLAATHGTLRQELAAAQHELQMLHGHIEEMKLEREHKTRGLMDKISKIEAELRAAEPIKVELQQARSEAQSLVAARQDLISKAQHLTQELQRAQSDVQQIPFLLSELDGLRQEYQHCRATFDYEKKLYSDHLESLQAMEKNYVTMAREVEKLRAELTNASNFERTTGGQYGESGNFAVQNAYSNGFGIPQGRAPSSVGANDGAIGAGSGAGAGADAAASASGGAGAGATPSGPGHAPPPHPAPRASYDGSRPPSYDTPRGPVGAGRGYDLQRGVGGPGNRGTTTGYEPQRGLGHDGQRGLGYEARRTSGYEGHGAPVYDAQRGSGHDAQRGGYGPFSSTSYDLSSGAAGPQGQVAPVNNAPYGSSIPPARGAGTKYETPPRGGNAAQR